MFGSRVTGTESEGKRSVQMSLRDGERLHLLPRWSSDLSHQPTVSHKADHLLPDFKFQLSQMLRRVDKDVSDALRFSDVALEPEIRFDYFNTFSKRIVHSNLTLH